jgi:hypothetical protein
MDDHTTMDAPTPRRRPGRDVRRRPGAGGIRRLVAIALAATATVLSVAVAAPASAAMDQVRGDASYDTCGAPPDGYEDFTSIDPLVMRGDLEGCLWTKAGPSRSTPSGVFLEQGWEVFVGTYRGGEPGTFETTYRFESKWDVTGEEIFGRCQHPILAGSGTGGFEGVGGRIFFKDEPPTYYYRGHLTFTD